MNVKCTYGGETVYIVGVNPLYVSGSLKVLLSYVDASNIFKIEEIAIQSNDIVADTVTEIDGTSL